MKRFVCGCLMFFALASASAVADEVRIPTSDAVVSGQWQITWNIRSAGGLTIGGHFVQVYSDGRVHWSDNTQDVRTFGRNGLTPGQARCEDSSELSGDDMAVLRDLVRAVYQIEIPDGPLGIGSAFLQVTVVRGGRNYVVGMANYQPSLENLDPRLKKAGTIFARYSCAAAAPQPQPLRG